MTVLVIVCDSTHRRVICVSVCVRTSNVAGMRLKRDNTDVFIDNTKLDSFNVVPIVNGLSDHNAELLNFKNIFVKERPKGILSRCSLINKDTIQNFLIILKKQDNIYGTEDVNDGFSSFLNTF